MSTNDYTTVEQTKLAGITAGATVNSTDAVLLARANHTGEQAISTITDLSTNLSDKFSKTASNEITGLTGKATITDADVLMIDDVADTGKKKKVSALNAYNYINNKLQAQFNNKVGISNTETIDGIKTFSNNIIITAIPTLDNHSARLKDVVDSANNKFSKTASNEINILTNKSPIVNADVMMIEDSASSFSKKKTSISDVSTRVFANSSNRNMVFLSLSGSDTNNGYSQETAVATLTQALTIAGNVGNQIEVLPAVYTGDYSITQLNVSICGSNLETRGICSFSGTLTSSNASSSQGLQGLTIGKVIHSGAGSLYLRSCTISGVAGSSLVASGNGYLDVDNVDFSTGTITITGSGNKNLNNTKGGILTVNNASAIVNVRNALTIISPTLTAGTLSISNCPIYSVASGTNAITTSAGSVLYLSNVSIVNPDGTNAKINIPAGAFYSFNNVIYDRANSTIAGTNLNREASFDKIIASNKQDTINDGNKINVIATDVASASTVNLDNATGDIVNITGTTTITAITLSAGIKRFVRFAGILTLTNGASLVLPSGANIITAVGDTAIFIGYASGVVRCVSYTKANGTALVGGGAGGGDVSSVETTTTDGQMALFNGTTGKSIKKLTDSGFIKLTAGVPTAQTSISGAEIAIASSTLNNFVAIGSSGAIVDSNKKLNNTATPTDNDIWSGLKIKTYVDSSISSDTVVSFSPLASAGQSLDASTHKFSIFTCVGCAFATLPTALNNAGKVMKIACSSTSVGKLYINGSEKGTNQYYILSSDTAIFECDGNKWILISGPDYVVPALGSGKQTNGRGFVMAYKENLFGCGIGDQNTAGNPFSPSNYSYTLSQFPLLDTGGSIYKDVVTGWQEVLTSYEMAIALTNEGEVFCWGNVWSNGAGGKSRFPRKQVFPAGVVISKVFMTTERNASVYHALYALSTTGKLYAWGNNEWGNLGINSTTNQNNPVLITTLQNVIITKFSVSAGYGIFCGAIDSTGQLWAWGWNGGLGGNGNGSPLGNGTTGTQLIVPTQVSDGTALIANATDVLCISGANAGGYSTAATRIIRADGSSWATGYNGGGSLGINTTTSVLRYTRETTLKTNIVEIAGSSTFDNHISAIITGDEGTDPNKVFFATGVNSRGIIGRGDTNASIQFTLNATQLSAGFQGKMYNNKGIKCKVKMHGSNNTTGINCGILDGDGNFYVSGFNSNGYCADGTTTDVYTFNKVKFYTNRRVVDFIFVGYGLDDSNRGVVVVFEDGLMASWGINNNGALGNQIYPSASANPFPQWVIGFEPFNKK